MTMDRLAAMETFVRAVDAGSFSGATKQLRVGQPAVSPERLNRLQWGPPLACPCWAKSGLVGLPRRVMPVKVDPGTKKCAVIRQPSTLRNAWASPSVSTFTPAFEM
jgi:hypothetical protein